MKLSSVFLNVAKTELIQDVANAAVIASRDLKSLLKQLLIRKSMWLSGKSGTKTETTLNAGDGMKGIWKKPAKCRWSLPKNIIKLKTDVKNEHSVGLIGKRKILKSAVRMIEQCMRLKRENSFDHQVAKNVAWSVSLMRTMRITQNRWTLCGFVQNAISIYITAISTTVNDLAKRRRKVMRKSALPTKAEEVGSKCPARHVNFHMVSKLNKLKVTVLRWQAGGKAKFIYLPPGYNNDPCMLRHTAGCSFYQGQCIKVFSINDLRYENVVHLKPTLIDMECLAA